jgi:hypothetical protein
LANRHPRGIAVERGDHADRAKRRFREARSGLGVHAEGPIANPDDLGAAIGRALAVVKRGEPALVEVVTQPR